MTKAYFMAIALIGVISLILIVPGSSYASQRGAQGELIPGAAAIPYRGYLTDLDGHPVTDGRYDFTFTLFAGEHLNAPLWSEEQLGVNLAGGYFLVELGSAQPLPSEVAQSEYLSLLVAVRGPGEASYTTLNPLQSIGSITASAPAEIDAGPACAHDHYGEKWEGADSSFGLYVSNLYADGEGGIFYGLDIGSHSRGLNIGVVGETGAGFVEPSTTVGVLGETHNGIGVLGQKSGTEGYAGRFDDYSSDYRDLQLGGDIGRIYANDNANSALWLTSNADIWLILDNDGSGSNSLKVKSGGTDVCTIDESGNLNCDGTKSAAVETTSYGKRLMYAIESPEVWFEDIGSGMLVDGEAFVGFEAVFAETVNLSEDYQVTLTAVCSQPILLSVSEKTPQGFSVLGVTLDGQPSDCGFDYRISAKRLGYEDQRLAPVLLDESEVGDG